MLRAYGFDLIRVLPLSGVAATLQAVGESVAGRAVNTMGSSNMGNSLVIVLRQ